MTLLEGIALGVMQGLTEFLPVSSSAHLSLLQYFLGLADTPRFFDVMLHVGTLTAVLVFYRQALWGWVRQLWGAGPQPIETSNANAAQWAAMNQLGVWKLAAYLILATIPAVAAAAVFRPSKSPPAAMGEVADNVARSATSIGFRQRIGNLREYSSRTPWVVIGFLVCTGVVLVIGSRAVGGLTDAQHMRWYHAVTIGIAQAFSAMFPGLSRSGMTVSTGLVLGLRGDWAVHFSLLMSIPAILGAVVLKTADVDPAWLTSENLVATAAGTVSAAVVGWLCIWLLLGAVRRGRWWWFAVYVWSVAAGVASVLSLTAAV